MNSESNSAKPWSLSKSTWNIHRFEIWSGEPIAAVEVLRMKDSLFLWIGDGAAPRLEELALAMASNLMEQCTSELATELFNSADGTNSRSKNLAMRLAKGLNKHVYVSCNLNLDRLSWPLVEKGLMTEIKNRPNYF